MQKQKSAQAWYSRFSAWDMLLLALEFGFVIGVPLVLFVGWGHQLDVRLNHAHCYDITGALLALLLSGSIIGWRIWGMSRSVGLSH